MSHSLVRVAHSVEGRIRLKVKHGKGNPELLNAFADKFRGLPGIQRVKTNPVTGTVVLIYDRDRHREFLDHVERSAGEAEARPAPPKTELDRLADAIQSEAEYLAENSRTARAVVDFFKTVDREIKAASNNTVDLKIALAGGMVAAMFMEIGATSATPVWVTLLLFGANNYIELQAQALKAREDEAREDARGAQFGKARSPRPGKDEARAAPPANEAEGGETGSAAGAGI
jgi:hypothetical protein